MGTVKALHPASLGDALGKEIASLMHRLKVFYVWGRLQMS